MGVFNMVLLFQACILLGSAVCGTMASSLRIALFATVCQSLAFAVTPYGSHEARAGRIYSQYQP